MSDTDTEPEAPDAQAFEDAKMRWSRANMKKREVSDEERREALAALRRIQAARLMDRAHQLLKSSDQS